MVSLEKLFAFADGSKILVENSQFRDKIKLLVDNPDYGEIPNRDLPFYHPSFDQPPNCFGSIDWIIDKNSQSLQFMMSSHFEKKYLLEENKLQQKKVDSIIAFRLENQMLVHTALYIGECETMNAVVHQRGGTGGQYYCDPLELVLYDNPTFELYEFYRVSL